MMDINQNPDQADPTSNNSSAAPSSSPAAASPRGEGENPHRGHPRGDTGKCPLLQGRHRQRSSETMTRSWDWGTGVGSGP
jgi:hypothetical protein